MPAEFTTLPNGCRIAHVNAGETALLYREIFTDRCYMRHGIVLRPGEAIFDVGANIGMAALFFHLECPDAAVYAFEPAPIPFAALAENMELHGIRGLPQQVAIADALGERDFSYYPRTTVMSGFHADLFADANLTRAFLVNSDVRDEENLELMLADKFEAEHIVSQVITLSQAINSVPADVVNLLKIDVEKSELNVLRGLHDDDWPKVLQIVAEVHDVDGTLPIFCELLRSRGFEVIVEQDKFLQGTEVWEVFAVRGRSS